jgi:hypothetical protein
LDLLAKGVEDVEAMIECLIRRQQGKPGEPIVAQIIGEAALREVPLKMTEEIDGDEFMISESRLAVIAHPLNFQNGMFIVTATAPDIELDELMFHNPMLQLFVGLLFYP